MKLLSVFAALFCVSAVALPANADMITITALDVRGTGVFGHDLNVSGVTVNGNAPSATNSLANPLDIVLTYSNLNLDGDASANDAVTFTIRGTRPTGNVTAMNQGLDAGFGNLDGLTVSVVNVSGTTTDLGNNIVFDGFTGANVAAGFNGAIDKAASINGTVVDLISAATGSFQFIQGPIDFALTPTLAFTDPVGNTNSAGGTLVARHYDLQFSTVAVPEPSSLALVGLAGGLIALRSRNKRSV
ncbi:hypothetical protein Poly51_29230 [Rubripirellula tenax]|uniref:Ice-binding protein C-terminal domain-containing protein n=1 Tax=Rubripirellula tenax TaxID=2528015 RepID=A0A5C6F7Q5_9BACT|nr:PEP-CTERM sorting domain-containing protein [Rubripirellula tenax]TWU57002.1 hypothetical protein Poly51_29230 [Rubripirellula tenax]